MSTSVRPEQDPKERIRRNVQKLADAGASTEEIEAYLADEGVTPAAPVDQRAASESTRVGAPPSRAVQQLALDIRQPNESTRALPHNRPNRAEDTSFAGISEGAGNVALAMPLVAAQIVPGAEAAEAALGSLGSQFTDRPMGLRESRDALRYVTDQIPAPIKMAAQAPALLKSAASLALSPAKAGAAVGAADQLLTADDAGPGERAIRALVGGTVGAAIPKGLEMVGTGARTIATPTTAKTLARLEGQRAASSAPLYDQAFTEGAAAKAAGSFNTPKVQALYQRPEVTEIAQGLKQLDEFKAVDLDSPEMLDGIYKVLSDRKGLLAKKLDAVSPNRVNLGRFDKRQIESIQRSVLDATDDVMPSYRAAVQDFAQGSAKLKGAERGHDALRSRLNRNLPMARSLKNTAPESYERYLASVPPEVAAEAERGVLGATKAAFGQSVRKSGVPALSEAPALLRRAKSPTQLAQDRALRALILGTAAGVP